jgi:hypothetical protein
MQGDKPMKAVLYPFDPAEPIAGLMRDFPQLEWALAASPADIAREIGAPPATCGRRPSLART